MSHLLVLSFFFGCAEGVPTFYDGFGAHEESEGSETLEGSPFGPYLAGSLVKVYARPPERQAGSNELEFYSTDEGVLRVVSTTITDDLVVAELEAVGKGEARIELWKKDWNMGGTQVAVHDERYAEVLWGPGVLAGRDELQFELQNPDLVVGGTAVFKVHYWDEDGNDLYGAGLATVIGGEPALSATVITEWQGLQGDWIQLGGSGVGIGGPEVSSGGIHVQTLNMNVVDDAVINNLGLYTPDEEAATSGDTLYAAALAFDATNEPLFGLPVVWELDGEPSGVVGEVFPYTYDASSKTQSLGIEVSGIASAQDIKMGDGIDEDGGSCSHAPRSRVLDASLVVALLALVRRRESR